MSYDLNVYARRVALPTPEQLASALTAASPSVELGDQFPDLRQRCAGFAPVRLEGRATGFELYASGISSSRADDFRADVEESGESMTGGNATYFEALTTCDRLFLFVCHDETERPTNGRDVVDRTSGGAPTFDHETAVNNADQLCKKYGG
jgi:hypothetical protein